MSKPLSDKAKLIYAALEVLNAVNEENKVNSYIILNTIVEDTDSLEEHELLVDMDEELFSELIYDASIKSINTIIAALVRNEIVVKTNPIVVKIDGTTRSLRHYYLKK